MRRATVIATLALTAFGSGSAGASSALVHFKSPSGNINCIGGATPAFVECLTRRAAWPRVPAKPKDCVLDWQPYSLAIERRRVVLGACRGDVGPLCYHDCTTLAYGRSVAIGPIRCRSDLDGVTCRYASGGRAGFRIAREGYTVWRA